MGSTGTGSAVGDSMMRKSFELDQELKRATIRREDAHAGALVAEARSRTLHDARQASLSDPNAPIPLWVPYQDRDGNIHYGPNPEIADLEQLPMPAAIQGITGPVVNDRIEVHPLNPTNPYWTGRPSDYGPGG